jgi:hypothetical protein
MSFKDLIIAILIIVILIYLLYKFFINLKNSNKIEDSVEKERVNRYRIELKKTRGRNDFVIK